MLPAKKGNLLYPSHNIYVPKGNQDNKQSDQSQAGQPPPPRTTSHMTAQTRRQRAPSCAGRSGDYYVRKGNLLFAHQAENSPPTSRYLSMQRNIIRMFRQCTYVSIKPNIRGVLSPEGSIRGTHRRGQPHYGYLPPNNFPPWPGVHQKKIRLCSSRFRKAHNRAQRQATL